MTDEVKTVFLGMPSYGAVEAAAAEAFYCASQSDKLRVLRQQHGGSALVQNFNALWCLALNRGLHGDPVDYFAMQHSDVAPQHGWLDALIEELEAKSLDVLSVALPIKADGGATSTALDGDDGWHVATRLTQYELQRLPSTFTSDDVGRPLLVNTGCWVCRFDQKWVREWTPFAQRDKISFDTELKRYVAEYEPEDWFFSRLCHLLDLRIGCTTKIPAVHIGSYQFSNRGVWGEPHDSTFVSSSLVPEVDANGFRYPHDVAGWLSYDEGAALYDLCAGKRVLEIGSYAGKSSICIAQSAESTTCVDTWDGRDTPQPRDTFEEFRDNVARYGLTDKVRQLVAGEPLQSLFDVAFIDAAHDRESVERDAELATAHLAPGGLLMFHDYRKTPGECNGGWNPGVTEAVERMLLSGGELLERHGTIAVVRPPSLEYA